MKCVMRSQAGKSSSTPLELTIKRVVCIFLPSINVRVCSGVQVRARERDGAWCAPEICLCTASFQPVFCLELYMAWGGFLRGVRDV